MHLNKSQWKLTENIVFDHLFIMYHVQHVDASVHCKAYVWPKMSLIQFFSLSYSTSTQAHTHWHLAWHTVCSPVWELLRTQGMHLSSNSTGHVGCTIQLKTSHVCSLQGYSAWCLSPSFPEQHPILIDVIQFWWTHCHLSAKMKHIMAGQSNILTAQM